MKNVFTSVVNQIKVDFLQELGHNILAEDASLDLLVSAGAMMVSNSDEDAANTYDMLAGVVGSAALDARRIPLNAFDDIFIKKAVEVLEDNIREAAAEECKERSLEAMMKGDVSSMIRLLKQRADLEGGSLEVTVVS
jgi:hypothetical protein